MATEEKTVDEKAAENNAAATPEDPTEPETPLEELPGYLEALDSGKLSEIKKYLGEFYDVQTKPNIAFIGYRQNVGKAGAKVGDPGFVPREPITQFSDGMDTIKVQKDQRRPFFHKEAARIIAAFPELYKPVID